MIIEKKLLERSILLMRYGLLILFTVIFFLLFCFVDLADAGEPLILIQGKEVTPQTVNHMVLRIRFPQHSIGKKEIFYKVTRARMIKEIIRGIRDSKRPGEAIKTRLTGQFEFHLKDGTIIPVPAGFSMGGMAFQICYVGTGRLAPASSLKQIVVLLTKRMHKCECTDEKSPTTFQLSDLRWLPETNPSLMVEACDELLASHLQNGIKSDIDKSTILCIYYYMENALFKMKRYDALADLLKSEFEIFKNDQTKNPTLNWPWSAFVEYRIRLSLAEEVYEPQGKYKEALSEYQKIDRLLSEELISKTTSEHRSGIQKLKREKIPILISKSRAKMKDIKY